MKITKVNCPACGAPISIPEDLDSINCSYCGIFFGREGDEGSIMHKVAEKLTREIEDSGKGTQEAISEPCPAAELESRSISSDISDSTALPLKSSPAPKLIQPTDASPGTKKKVDVKSIGKGFTCSILMATGFTFVGCFIAAIYTPDLEEMTGPQWFLSLMIPTLGFLLGSWIFLRNAAPNATIQRFLFLPEIRFSSKVSTKGIQNPIAVKTILGIIVWVFTWLFAIALIGLSTDIPDIYSYIIMVGVPLGPIQGLITFIKTTVATEQLPV